MIFKSTKTKKGWAVRWKSGKGFLVAYGSKNNSKLFLRGRSDKRWLEIVPCVVNFPITKKKV